METIIQYNEFIAVTIARTFLGLLFIFQGYDAIFNIGLQEVTATYHSGFSNKRIPRQLTKAAAWFTSYTELIGGGLLIIGLWQYIALYLLGINLLIAAFGFGLVTPLWDTRHVWPRLSLILFLLLVPASWLKWSLDALLFHLK